MNKPVATSALLLFAHGSSDPRWAEPFYKLKAAILARDPDRIVEVAFLERIEPSFESAADALQARGIRHVTVAPLFLAIGGHMRKDLPKLIDAAQQRTSIEFRVLPALGEVDSLLDATATWVLFAQAQDSIQ